MKKEIIGQGRWILSIIFLLMSALLFSTPLFAEGLSSKILLQNGDVITGEIKQQIDGKITVKTQFGEIILNSADVYKIENSPNVSEYKPRKVQEAPAVTGETTYDGFYVGGGFVYNDFKGDDLNSFNPGTGWDFKLGYNFGLIALEANVFKSTHSADYPKNDWTLQGILLNVKAYYIPATKRVRGFFSIGYGDYELDGSTTSTNYYLGSGFHFGPGVEIFFNEHLALNFNILYRDIKYDKHADATSGGVKSMSSSLDGSAGSTQLGFNVYF